MSARIAVCLLASLAACRSTHPTGTGSGQPAPATVFPHRAAPWSPMPSPAGQCLRVAWANDAFRFEQGSNALGSHWVVTGTFAPTTAHAYAPADAQATRVEFELDAASVATGQEARDRHLRADDFLDVARHPTLRFRSSRVTFTGRTATLEGDLELLGRTVHYGPAEPTPAIVLTADRAWDDRLREPLVVTGSFVVSKSRFGWTTTRTVSASAAHNVIEIEDDVRVSLRVRVEPAPCEGAATP